eukprot:TRINITY_DN5115_c0_g1_i1.p1 TRINITY_DN5115_c0_g1~~TRINITY_DN5115_c0_g1_i1.p1  ORF type:complete len:1331 (-),score=257.95 TRINITY_DN5115_c0_g1_i1:15-3548(-)
MKPQPPPLSLASPLQNTEADTLVYWARSTPPPLPDSPPNSENGAPQLSNHTVHLFGEEVETPMGLPASCESSGDDDTLSVPTPFLQQPTESDAQAVQVEMEELQSPSITELSPTADSATSDEHAAAESATTTAGTQPRRRSSAAKAVVKLGGEPVEFLPMFGRDVSSSEGIAETQLQQISVAAAQLKAERLFDDDADNVTIEDMLNAYFTRMKEQTTAQVSEESSENLLQEELFYRHHSAEDYRDFSKMLDAQECKKMKTTFEAFFRGFRKHVKGRSMEVEARCVHQFLVAAERAMTSRSPWSGMPPTIFAIARESMHKFVLSRLYNTLFNKKQLQEKDDALSAHIAQLQPMVQPVHVELSDKFIDNDLLHHAQDELEPLNSLITPFEKLACISNACKMLMSILQTAGSNAGADEFLPLLVWLLISVNLPRLHSNLSYIERFADPREKFEEPYYYFTHLVSATTFVETLKPETLSHRVSLAQQDQRVLSLNLNNDSANAYEELKKVFANLHYVGFPESKMTKSNTPLLLQEHQQLFQAAHDLLFKISIPVSFSPEPNVFIALHPSMFELPDADVTNDKQRQIRAMALINGFIWLAAANMIFVYVARTPSFVCSFPMPGCSRVYCMAAPHSRPGEVWCGTESGIISVEVSRNYRNRAFTSIPLAQAKVQYILPVACGDTSAMWSFSVSEDAATRITTFNQPPQPTKKQLQHSQKLTIPYAVSCVKQHGLSVWVGTATGELLAFDVTHAVQRSELRLPVHQRVSCVCSCADHLWVASESPVITVLDPESCTVVMTVKPDGRCFWQGVLGMRTYGARTVVTAHLGGRVLLWDAMAATLVGELHCGLKNSSKFTPVDEEETSSESETPPPEQEAIELKTVKKKPLSLPPMPMEAAAAQCTPVLPHVPVLPPSPCSSPLKVPSPFPATTQQQSTPVLQLATPTSFQEMPTHTDPADLEFVSVTATPVPPTSVPEASPSLRSTTILETGPRAPAPALLCPTPTPTACTTPAATAAIQTTPPSPQPPSAAIPEQKPQATLAEERNLAEHTSVVAPTEHPLADSAVLAGRSRALQRSATRRTLVMKPLPSATFAFDPRDMDTTRKLAEEEGEVRPVPPDAVAEEELPCGMLRDFQIVECGTAPLVWAITQGHVQPPPAAASPASQGSPCTQLCTVLGLNTFVVWE